MLQIGEGYVETNIALCSMLHRRSSEGRSWAEQFQSRRSLRDVGTVRDDETPILVFGLGRVNFAVVILGRTLAKCDVNAAGVEEELKVDPVVSKRTQYVEIDDVPRSSGR